METAGAELPLPAILADAVLSGGLGFCVTDSQGHVLRRDGSLSQWAPAPGEALFGHPVIESFREAVFAMRATTDDIVVPGIGLRGAAGHFKLDIRFVWMQRGTFLLVTSSQAAARAELEATIAQSRREQQILEETLRARELQLAGQRQLMSLFIAHVPAAIAMLDHQLNYVAVSDRWCAEFGLAAEAARPGMSCQQSLPGASAQWRQGLADALAGGHSLCDLDTLTAGHGRAEWLRWRFLPWHLPPVQPGGAPQGGVLLFCEIITLAVENSRKLEEQARQLHSANVDMRNVSLALSHDLQAPVRQMVKFAQLLDADSGAALDGSSRDFLAEIHAAGARMQRMIAGLLRYLRIASRQPALYPVETGEAVAAALANLRHDIDATQAQVSVGPLPNIQGDAQLLTLLFQNLVQNSLKYAARAALHIEIAARRDGDTWKITCRDNGPGIALHGAGKAFDLFQRLDDRKDIAGTGVGLAICRWIAEVHAGTLEIIAAAGPGLCLSLTLPVAASQAPVSSGAPV